MPMVVPGMTRPEYEWKLAHMGSTPIVAVVGDSRIGWGFSEQAFDQHARNSPPPLARAFNLGAPAHSIEALVRHLLVARPDCRGCVMVINFSPAGLYTFDDGFFPPGTPLEHVTLQDRIDDWIRSTLGEQVFTLSQNWRVVASTLREALRATQESRKPWVTWVERTAFDGGFYNAQLASSDGKPVDHTEYQLDYYRTILLRMRSAPGLVTRKQTLLAAVAEAQARGWRAVLVRFPIGRRMRQLEDGSLEEAFRAEAVARDGKLQLIDYDDLLETRDLPTLDESHLTPNSARAMGARLAADLARR
jgi:hypothetical protein